MYPKLNEYEVNHIKTSLSRCTAQGLADELGTAKETVDRKIQELRESERIANICQYAKEKKSEKKRGLRRVKHRIKRRIKGGV